MKNPEKPTRELFIGEIISMTFSLYSSRFLLLVTPFLIGGAIMGIASTAVQIAFPFPAVPSVTADLTAFWNWFVLFISTLVIVVILQVIISLIVGSITGGIAIKCISDQLEKGTVSLQESFRYALSRLPSLIGVQLLTGVIIGIGLLLLVIPGIIFAIMFSLVLQVLIIEQTGVFESLGRSRRLVGNRWGKTFGVLLVISIITLVVAWIASVIAAPFGIASTLVSGLISAVASPIYPIALTLLYYSMRARELPPPPPPPPI